jgi:hypothetical protein
MKTTYLCIFLVFSKTLFSQMDTNKISKESLNTEVNIIKSGTSLSRFTEKLKGLKKGKSNIQIMHYGDSHIAMGHFSGRFLSHLQQEFSSTKLQRWLHFSFKNPIRYHNKGVGGSQYMVLFEKRQEVLDDITEVQPDLIIFSFGTNESYKPGFDSTKNAIEIKRFIEDVKKLSPKTELLFSTSPDTHLQYNFPPHADAINSIVKTIATESNGAIWDLNQLMGKNSMSTWIDQKLGHVDRLHFTIEGYQLHGDLLFLALMKLL